MAVLKKRAALKKLRNLVFTQRTDLPVFRSKIEKEFSVAILPNHVECRLSTVRGVPSDMLIPQVSSNRRMILYVHGGTFMGGSRTSWRNFCSSLANESSSRVLLPDYRLAPEHAFPAGLEDIVSVYKRMCDHNVDVFLAGDGSGAGIAIAAALSIPKDLRQFFKGMLLFSPWVDYTKESLMYKVKTPDPLFSADGMRFASAYYTYSSNFSNPLVSPLKAPTEDFIGFPPVYIQMGANEMVLPCVKQFSKKLHDAGVDCTLKIYDGLFHFFQFVHDEIGQSHLALEEAGKFVKTVERFTAEPLTEGDLWS